MFRLVGAFAVVAAVLVASAGAVPPPPVAHIAVTHLRPVAGHTFTGVTITPLSTIVNVTCPARVDGKEIRARKQRFYEPGVGLVAITCSWRVPASARGTLSTQVAVESTALVLTSPVLRWRIKG